MPGKSLVIDVHHHWMPDEHYRRPELHVHPDEEVIHEPDRFRIRRAGVQLFSPPRITARMDEQLKMMDRAGVDRRLFMSGSGSTGLISKQVASLTIVWQSLTQNILAVLFPWPMSRRWITMPRES